MMNKEIAKSPYAPTREVENKLRGSASPATRQAILSESIHNFKPKCFTNIKDAIDFAWKLAHQDEYVYSIFSKQTKKTIKYCVRKGFSQGRKLYIADARKPKER